WGRRDAIDCALRADFAAVTKLGLQRRTLRHVVERIVGTQRVPRLARKTFLGRDDHDAGTGARTVNGRRGRTFLHVDRRDVVGIDVRRAVRRRYTTGVRLGGHGRVVDRHAVHDEQRLRITGDRLGSANADVRRRARVAGLRYDFYVRRLTGQRRDDVRLVGPGDQRRVHRVDRRTEAFARDARAFTGDDHFTEAQRVRAEREVLRQVAGTECDLNRLRL